MTAPRCEAETFVARKQCQNSATTERDGRPVCGSHAAVDALWLTWAPPQRPQVAKVQRELRRLHREGREVRLVVPTDEQEVIA